MYSNVTLNTHCNKTKQLHVQKGYLHVILLFLHDRVFLYYFIIFTYAVMVWTTYDRHSMKRIQVKVSSLYTTAKSCVSVHVPHSLRILNVSIIWHETTKPLRDGINNTTNIWVLLSFVKWIRLVVRINSKDP